MRHLSEQEAQLYRHDTATLRVSWNLVKNCAATVPEFAYETVCNRWMTLNDTHVRREWHFSHDHRPISAYIYMVCVWPGGVVVRALDSRLEDRGFDSRPPRCQVRILGKLFTRTHTHCHQAEWIGTGQRTVMPYGWEGNRRSGVALAMRHRFNQPFCGP